MALITNSLTTYGVTTNREDLADTVYRIDPVDTPFLSMAPKVRATAVLHEWSTQALATINAANAALEGDEISRAAVIAPVRLQNFCQISQKNATVTETQRAVDPAGIDDMLDEQVLLKGLELRRDMEAGLLGNSGQNAGGATIARRFRSFNAWFSGNALRGTGGADSTTATAAATDATTGALRTFTEALLRSALLLAYNDGGKPTTLLVGPANKQRQSDFTGRASARQAVDQSTILAAADLYASDYGTIKVVPNRSQRERDAYLVDFTKVAVAFLPGRNMARYRMGKIGDAETVQIVSEYTLEMRHRDAHAGIFDLTT